MYPFLDTLYKLFRKNGKSSKLILLGVVLIALSNYIPSSTLVPFQNLEASVALLWFGIFSFAYGFVLYSIEAYEESKLKIPQTRRRRKRKAS